MATAVATGTVHKIPSDIKAALLSDVLLLAKWNDLTSLARNEWICWTISVKRETTRKDHLKRLKSEIKEGKRRPCCWIGCIHRTDKSLSPSVRGILSSRGAL